MTNKNEIIQFRVDAASMDQLTAVSKQQNLSISVMVRSWVTDRLRQELLLASSSRQKWQAERLSEIEKMIEAKFPPGPVLVIHAFPLTPNAVIDPTKLSTTQGALLPLQGVLPISGRINRHGYYVVSEHHNQPVAVAQVFKTGQIESVKLIDAHDKEIFGLMLDNAIVMSVLTYIGVLSSQQLALPYIFSVSLLRVKDCWLVGQPSTIPGIPHVAMQEDSFTLPDILIDKVMPGTDIQGMAQHLRPILDEVWQASGYDQALSFERNGGQWLGPGWALFK